MERGTSRPLSGTDYAYGPFWSADGRFVAFGTSDTLLKRFLPAAAAPRLQKRSRSTHVSNR
jgi:hypothetical protein